MDLVKIIKQSVDKVLTDFELGKVEYAVEHPADMSRGDYACNVAMVGIKKSKGKFKSPRELAEKIVEKLKDEGNLNKIVSEISVAGAGFINISMKNDTLINLVGRVINDDDKVDTKSVPWGKKVMVEYAHPNTHKQFHIGHLRNISLGESITRILEAVGVEVIRTNYQGDVGLHIAKAIWGINSDSKGYKLAQTGSIHDKVKFLGKAYVKGSKAYEDDEKKKEIQEINKKIYKGEATKVYKETRQWSLDYFDLIYKRVGTKYDRLYFESECKDGLEVAKKALEKGVLKKSKGAVVFDGEPYGLHTRVFVNSEGLPTYEAKELALAPKEFTEFGEIDKNIHVVGPEQKSFFEVTFKVEELLDPEMFKGKQHHRVYGFVNLKSGKMSSRKGKVVTGWWLMDEAKKKVIEEYKVEEKKAEKIAVGAVKYAFLKVQPLGEIAFDLKESISLEGNSGPYLQYTYARCKSVLGKSKFKDGELKPSKFEKEEKYLLKILSRFSEVVGEAAEELAPNLVANYLFELAQKFNTFYNKHSILKAKENQKLRLWLTKATAEVIGKGLYLLGISAPERM